MERYDETKEFLFVPGDDDKKLAELEAELSKKKLIIEQFEYMVQQIRLNALNNDLNVDDVIEKYMPELLNKLKSDDKTLITCSNCGEVFNEDDVNIIDFELDLCLNCEKHMLKKAKRDNEV